MSCRASQVKVEAAEPSIAAVDATHAAEGGIAGEAAATAEGLSPKAKVQINGADEEMSDGDVQVNGAVGEMSDGDVQVSVEPAAAIQKHNGTASTPVQGPNHSSGVHSRNAEVKDASATSGEAAAAVVVQISDGDKGTSDGEVRVNVVSSKPGEKPAKPASVSVEISEGQQDKADGSITVDITAVTAAKAARAQTHMPEDDAARASGKIGVTNKAGRQPSKAFNWLVGDTNQAGSASGNQVAKADQKPGEPGLNSMGADEGDDNVVQVTVDTSLLG